MTADTKMMAVRWKRGCSRIIAASSKPSRSGMHTSMRINAMSFFSRHSNASRAEHALSSVLADLGEHDLMAQQLRLLIVDQQDIHLVGGRLELGCGHGGRAHRCSHIRSADSNCSTFTGFAR